MRIAERSKLSAVEYLAWEREQPTKHEYFHGDVFAMAGGSPRHNLLCAEMLARLRETLRDACRVFTSDQRIGVETTRYVYPDVSAVCGSFVMQPGTSDVITNPSIIVEVLSASTEQYDRGLKWEGYQHLASLTDYVLVSQVAPRIELYQRDRSGGWTYRAFGPGERFVLTSGAELAVDTIYFPGVFDLPGE
ncbi:MAG: Uma2 family endonuclease [Kofleriaceae bacterium]